MEQQPFLLKNTQKVKEKQESSCKTQLAADKCFIFVLFLALKKGGSLETLHSVLFCLLKKCSV